jgi:hypothetical protein
MQEEIEIHGEMTISEGDPIDMPKVQTPPPPEPPPPESNQ